MKDKKQYPIYILLVVNIIFCIVLMVGQANLSGEINNMMSNSYYNLKLVSSDINSQLEETLMRDRFKVIDMNASFSGYLNDEGLMLGNFEFGLTDNKDVDGIYLIVENNTTGDSEKIKAISVGGLRYKAEVELDYKSNYTYYAMSENNSGEKMMLSDMCTIELQDKMRERVGFILEYTSYASNELAARGIIYINDDAAEIVKVELKWMSFDDDSYMMNREPKGSVVIDTLDITDRLLPTGEVDVNAAKFDDEKGCRDYGFDVTITPSEGEYDIQEFIDIVLVVTFSDGVEIELME